MYILSMYNTRVRLPIELLVNSRGAAHCRSNCSLNPKELLVADRTRLEKQEEKKKKKKKEKKKKKKEEEEDE
ncbi:hypothetical protein QYF36_014842 [Acer negundo]|nr:hypothetical protein QYF36_014842 [Acer negundo]